MASAGDKRNIEPLRGPAQDDAATTIIGRPRRGDLATVAALAICYARRRPCCATYGRTRHRQVAHRSYARRAASVRTTHPLALFLLSTPHQQCAFPVHRPTRKGRRVHARRFACREARQARNPARAVDRRPGSDSSTSGPPSVTATQRSLLFARADAPESKGEDVGGDFGAA